MPSPFGGVVCFWPSALACSRYVVCLRRYNLDSELKAPVPHLMESKHSAAACRIEGTPVAQTSATPVQAPVEDKVEEATSDSGLTGFERGSPAAHSEDERERDAEGTLAPPCGDLVDGTADEKGCKESADCLRAFLAAQAANNDAHLFVVVCNELSAGKGE